jgi:hypothetical protein
MGGTLKEATCIAAGYFGKSGSSGMKKSAE